MSSVSCDHIASIRDPLPAVPVTHHANFSLRFVACKPDNYGGRKRGEHRNKGPRTPLLLSRLPGCPTRVWLQGWSRITNPPDRSLFSNAQPTLLCPLRLGF